MAAAKDEFSSKICGMVHGERPKAMFALELTGSSLQQSPSREIGLNSTEPRLPFLSVHLFLAQHSSR